MGCFRFAFRGILRTVQNERNMRIHLAFSFYVILAGLICPIEAWQWCALLGCIAVVTALECVNTAIEAVCDEVSREYSRNIEIAKDAAAGAVLGAAIISAVIGGIIFFNSTCIGAAINFAKEYPLGAAAIVLTVPLWIKFILMRRAKK